MIKKQTVESQLHCKATAELDDSIINDMLKTDGNLKELLDEDRPSDDQSDNGDSATSPL